MGNIIYKDLSYMIVGIAYKVDNDIGAGQSEKVYCDAIEKLLIKEKIKYNRELYAPIKVDDELVAKRYFDFLIDDKIIVEVKVGNYAYKPVITQLLQYLKQGKYKLGIVIRFTKSGVINKRIVNINS